MAFSNKKLILACSLRKSSQLPHCLGSFILKQPYFSFKDRVEYKAKSDFTSARERVKTVSAYYNQPAIDAAAQKPSVRLTPYSILYSGSGDGLQILKSVQYLQRELLVRIARRIVSFRSLPFIIGCNPTILGVHELYIRSFNILNSFDPIQNPEDEVVYSNKLKELLEDHKNVATELADGFRQCQKHITDEKVISEFLDETLTSRLGIRMLAEHHLAIRDPKPNYIGIINVNMSVKDVIDRSCQFVTRMARHKYGKTLDIKLSGHVNATFPYIEIPLDYILPELLKNGVRATLEFHSELSEEELPPLRITVASNDKDFVIRISDRGGGIPHHLMEKVLKYNFSTAQNQYMDDYNGREGVFSEMVEAVNPSPTGGPMHGFGFGLPTSNAYARYMGGDLDLYPMQGIGTDVYLRLNHINSKAESFRI